MKNKERIKLHKRKTEEWIKILNKFNMRNK